MYNDQEYRKRNIFSWSGRASSKGSLQLGDICAFGTDVGPNSQANPKNWDRRLRISDALKMS